MIGFILCLFVDWPMIGWEGRGEGGAYKRQFALLLNCLSPLGWVSKCWVKGGVGEQFPQTLILTKQFFITCA